MGSRLRVGIVGLGPWGLNLVQAFSRTERCDVQALCDVSPERRRLASIHATTASVHTDFDELLRTTIDAVAIATPSGQHARMALEALAVGKHVFVEKPLALGLHEARAVQHRWAGSDLCLMVGHIVAYHPGVERLRAMLAAGSLGAPLTAWCERSSAHARGDAGVWWSLASHDVALLQLLLGQRARSIVVSSNTRTDAGESVTARLDFDTMVSATITVERPKAKRRRLWLRCEVADVLFDELAPSLAIRARARGTNSGEWETVAFSAEQPLLREVSHFAAGSLDGAPVVTDCDLGCEVVAVLEAGQRSLDSAAAVRIGHASLRDAGRGASDIRISDATG